MMLKVEYPGLGPCKEMQRDLCNFDTMVAIIPVIDLDDIERIFYEFFINAKPDHAICRMLQLCLDAAIYVLTATSNEA